MIIKVIKLNRKIPVIVLIGMLALLFCFLTFMKSIQTSGIHEVIMEDKNEIVLPIIMYHNVLPRTKLHGSIYVTPREFENDLKYIEEKEYASITMQDLIEYVYRDGSLPEKPIMITLDDGYLNNYVYVHPLLKKHNMKAVLSIIGKSTDDFTRLQSDNLEYSHATWDQVNEMLQSGFFEIQNHSYNLHEMSHGRVGSKMCKGEPYIHYEQLLMNDIGRLQKQITEKIGVTPTTFTYPFGSISKESVDILKKMGFQGSLSSYGGVNIITKDPNQLFGLKRNNRPHGISTKAFFKKLLVQT